MIFPPMGCKHCNNDRGVWIAKFVEKLASLGQIPINVSVDPRIYYENSHYIYIYIYIIYIYIYMYIYICIYSPINKYTPSIFMNYYFLSNET